jgi:SAM-dependent methyltransferase
MKTFLHVGCGPQNISHIQGFNKALWKEVRFDIDKNVHPDIEGTMLDMGQVEDASVDAIYSSHNIEHVYPHEVPIVLNEFFRVLRKDGIVVLYCPDLQSTCEAIVNDKLLNPLYKTINGISISPIDILYGHRDPIANGNHFMAHKCGFTYSVLDHAFSEAGFKTRYGGRNPSAFELFIVAFKQELPENEIKKIADPFF